MSSSHYAVLELLHKCASEIVASAKEVFLAMVCLSASKITQKVVNGL